MEYAGQNKFNYLSRTTLGVPARSKEGILEDPNVHVVYVHSKSYAMADLAIEALEAGRAVLCEKPAGRNAADVRRIAQTVERTGGQFQVVYCWRFSPAVDKMHEVLQTGRLGKVMQVRAHGACSHDEADSNHMKQPDDIGGALFLISCHLFDRVIYHFGMPRSVNARITKFSDLMGHTSREDAAGAVLNYDDKVVVVDFFSWDPLPWLDTWGITAYGTEGVMHSRPLPSSYRIYDKGNLGFVEGWTEWSETSYPINWASKRTAYSPDLAEIGNPVFFDRRDRRQSPPGSPCWPLDLQILQPGPLRGTHVRRSAVGRGLPVVAVAAAIAAHSSMKTPNGGSQLIAHWRIDGPPMQDPRSFPACGRLIPPLKLWRTLPHWSSHMHVNASHEQAPSVDQSAWAFLRMPHVVRMTGLGRSTIYRMIAEKTFPPPVRLGARAVAWRRSDLDQWSQTRPSAAH